MKVIICLAALIAVSVAKPVEVVDPKTATVVRYANENEGVNGYKFDFETSDGISREEQGQLKNVGTEAEALSVQGSYKYIAYNPEGVRTTYTVTYIADENGFVPVISETVV